MEKEIDFVIPWVDGSDQKWQEDKRKYQSEQEMEKVDSTEARYRDWGFLKYWFRSVEQNAPWVRKIHFITCGHLPQFLNYKHPKINIVCHSDYMPHNYLPTFSSHPIELNMHHINVLSEQFVYFNDDFFINAPVKKEFFFKQGKPCYEALEGLIQTSNVDEIYWHIILNNIAVINKNFDKYKVLKNNALKWFHIKYGKDVLRNVLLLPWSKFQGIVNRHLPVPFLKSTLEEVWDCEFDILDRTSMHRFRDITDVNQYLFRYWDIMKGNFIPTCNQGTAYHLAACDIDMLVKDIMGAKSTVLCINDGSGIEDFVTLQHKIIEAFEKRYPEKSSFEL